MKLFKITPHPLLDSLVVQEFEVARETPKYLWLAIVNTKNRFMPLKVRKRTVGSTFFPTPSAAWEAATNKQLAKIKKAHSSIRSAKEEIKRIEMWKNGY